MFKIEPNPKFWASVFIHVPGQGLGQIDVEFKHLKFSDRKKYVASLDEKSNIDALMEIMADWKGIDAGFSKENLEALLNEYPSAASAIYEKYWKELIGESIKN